MKAAAAAATASPFAQAYGGRVWSLMSWDQLAAFWARIDAAAGWYVYMLGEPVPTTPADAAAVVEFIARIDALLRSDHHENYCGIVYTDDIDAPTLVKIFDPNNLGSSCGSSKHPPGPGWVLSRQPPDALPPPRVLPEARRRWWREGLAAGVRATA